MRFPRCACFFACGFAFALLLTSASAQDRLRVGQEVEVQVRGQWIEAEVLRMMPGGQAVQVRIRENGRTQAGVVPLRSVRVPDSEEGAATAAGGPPAGEMRTWSDSTGQFQIEAVLVAKEGATVKLRKKDGAEISVPVSKLSRADVEYLATAPDPAAPPKAGSGFQVNDAVEVLSNRTWYPAKVLQVDRTRYFIDYDAYSENWNEWVGPERIRAPGAEAPPASAPASPGAPSKPEVTFAASTLNLETVSCNVKSAPAGTIEKSAPPKGLAADPAKLSPPPAGAVSLRECTIFESFSGMAQAGAETMLVAYIDEPPGKKYATTQFMWCNLKDGSVTNEAKVAGGHRPVVSDPAGGWLLTVDPDDETKVYVWEWADPAEAPSPAYAVTIGTSDPSPFAKRISGAHLAAGGRAVLATGGDQVILWSLEQRQAEMVWSGSRPAVSPGGRYLSLYGNDGMAVFEVAGGRQHGYWPLGYLAIADVAFSTDGRQLAFTYGGDELRVLDMNAGRTRHQGLVPRTASLADVGLLWTSEDYLLAEGKHLVDLKAGFVLWEYDPQFPGKGRIMNGFGGRVCYLAQEWGARRGPPALCAATLPHDEARQAVASADAAQLFGVAPGMEVSLQVNVSGADAQTVRAALEKQIAANGWKLNPAAPAKVVASITRGATETQTYSKSAFGREGTTVSYQPFIQTVGIVIDGEKVWTRESRTGPPPVLFSKEGQSLQQTASQYEKPVLEIFEKTDLPRRLVRPKFLTGLGKSQLTASGPAPAK